MTTEVQVEQPKWPLTICVTSAILLMMLIHSGCATTKSDTLKDHGVPSGQWNALANDCVEQEVSPAVYTCSKEVLEKTYDWMVDAFFDLQEYKLRLGDAQKATADAKTRDKGNNLYWFGGGCAVGVVTVVLGILLLK